MQIPWVKPQLDEVERSFLVDAIDSTWISGGPFVDRLEGELKGYLQASHAICVSNGTTALHLAMLGAGIGHGDEVIVPNFTFVAPGNMAIAVGATPVFADIDPKTWCISVSSARSLIGPKTKAILAVHIYGNAAPVIELKKLCDEKGILLIEDCAEGFASKLNASFLGTIGHIGTFSFHATKTMTTGEGGLVVCADEKTSEKMRVIRDHGMTPGKRYWHEEIGFNFRMTNFQAAIGCAQMTKVAEFLKKRFELHSLYRAKLRNTSFRLQEITPGCEPVIWALGVDLGEGISRDAVIERMKIQGIETRPGFYPFSIMPPYQQFKKSENEIENSVRISKRLICLPFFVGLTEREVDFIVENLIRASFV